MTAVGVTLSVLLAVVLLGMMVVARRGQTSATDFYLAGRRIGAGQSTLALFAAFVLFSTLFTMVGHIALNGFDAFIFAAGFAVSFLIAAFFFAGPLRSIRGTTIADLFALRADQPTARKASLLVTLMLYAMYTIVMLNAIGIVAGVLFGVSSRFATAVIVAVVGLLVTLFVYLGGQLGVTRMLVLKAVVVMAVIAVLTVTVLAKFKLNVFEIMNQAQAKALPGPGGYGLLEPGREFAEMQGPALHLSKLFAVLVGHAALPYMFMRYFTARSVADARKSAAWTGMLFVGFYLCTAILGFAAVAVLGGQNIGLTPPARDITMPALAANVMGPWMVGVLGAMGFLIVAGVLAALLMSAVTSATRDMRVLRGLPADEAAELQTARRNTLILGIGSVVVGVVLLPLNTHSFIPIVVSLAGAVILPAVLYSLYWKRFNATGLRWTIFGGMTVSLLAFVFSGLVSGTPVAFFPGVDFHFIDLDPALIGVPATFLMGYLGTMSSPEPNAADFAKAQVRAFTGTDLSADLSTTGRDERATPERATPERAKPERATPERVAPEMAAQSARLSRSARDTR
jgi:cation/acetate symporter